MKIGDNNFYIKDFKYSIGIISAEVGKEYIIKNHYSHGCSNGPSPIFGLFENSNDFLEENKLIGVCAFSTPCSENVRASIFGKEYKNRVIELHRLHILDCTPKNTESWFISKCLKNLKRIHPEKWAVISFSDSTEGHEGTIYKATNAYRLGTTGKAVFYLDENGRLRHPRQSGKNIDLTEAKKRNWTPTIREGKNRYLYLLPDNKKHKKYLIKLCKFKLEDSYEKIR
jgi:hypothetical protein